MFRLACLANLIVSVCFSFLHADEPSDASDSANWSELISSKTIESEVSWLQQQLADCTDNEDRFRRGGYRAARRRFAELAALLGIVDQSELQPRWKDVAGRVTPSFALAARVCEVGSKQSYDVARSATTLLDQILDQKQPDAADAEDWSHWIDIVDRSVLMHRMNELQQTIKADLADKSVFTEKRDQVQRHAELIAAIGSILRQPSMNDVRESNYSGYALRLTRFGSALARVSQRDDYEATQIAFKKLISNCSRCHESYR